MNVVGSIDTFIIYSFEALVQSSQNLAPLQEYRELSRREVPLLSPRRATKALVESCLSLSPSDIDSFTDLYST